MSIRQVYEAIQEEQRQLYQELKDLQARCKHRNVKKTHKADGGNYDRSLDAYWTEYDCPDCGKHWADER